MGHSLLLTAYCHLPAAYSLLLRPGELLLLGERLLVEALGGLAGGDDGVELAQRLFAPVEVREDAAAGEARAQDDGAVGLGRREEQRLPEVAERGVEARRLERLVYGLLRRERGRLPQREVDE